MNVVSRGVRNALRSPLRSGAIVLMLAISIGLIMAMLVARSSVNQKIASVKATTATAVTINPAGIQGGFGGGNPLTSTQVATITKTTHVSKVVSTLTDQLTSTNTNLTSAIQLGSFGARMQRLDQSGSSSTSSSQDFPDASSSTSTPATMMGSRITVTGTSDPTSVITTSSKLTSGSLINGTGSDLTADIGKTLASKNNLKVGSTFTAYSKTIKVVGIFDAGTTFENDTLLMPLSTIQSLSSQAGDVTSISATVDSAANVSSTVASLKKSLGSSADITSDEAEATSTLAPLTSIADLSLAAVIGASIAGAVIILLAMVMVVRERRREIGVIKAIGGSNGKVIGQFMSEALTLTIIGGVVGLGLGIVASGPMTQSLVSSSSTSSSSSTTQGGFGGGFNQSQSGTSSTTTRRAAGGFGGGFRSASQQIGTNITQVTSSLTPQTFLLSIGFILVISIIGSAVPAWFIARIRPAEVLRTE